MMCFLGKIQNKTIHFVCSQASFIWPLQMPIKFRSWQRTHVSGTGSKALTIALICVREREAVEVLYGSRPHDDRAFSTHFSLLLELRRLSTYLVPFSAEGDFVGVSIIL